MVIASFNHQVELARGVCDHSFVEVFILFLKIIIFLVLIIMIPMLLLMIIFLIGTHQRLLYSSFVAFLRVPFRN